MPVVQIEHLVKTYHLGFFHKKNRAVSDVSLSVEEGEIFGLLGPNGAGKTTTLKVLMGLIRPTAGKASVFGFPLGDLRAKKRLGYLPESPYFYEYLTGYELLIFMAKLFGLSPGTAQKRAKELLELVDMTRSKDTALRRYSKGMLQRIGIAQALIGDPELVILDEPLTGLDPIGRKDLRMLIADLRRQGKTVLLSSHILSDVEMLADRVTIVVKGRTIKSGPLHELLDAKILSTEVVVQDPSSELVEVLQKAGYSAQNIGEKLQIKIEGERDAGPLIDLIREHGGHLLEVTPRKETLEDLVVEQAKAQG